jgi:hypothetical protein
MAEVEECFGDAELPAQRTKRCQAPGKERLRRRIIPLEIGDPAKQMRGPGVLVGTPDGLADLLRLQEIALRLSEIPLVKGDISQTQQGLAFPGREPNWGPRVTLRKLTITNGVATADFSRELKAYGGGSLRVKLIRGQITQTLKQFPTVRVVRIAIEGQTEAVLEP